MFYSNILNFLLVVFFNECEALCLRKVLYKYRYYYYLGI